MDRRRLINSERENGPGLIGLTIGLGPFRVTGLVGRS